MKKYKQPAIERPGLESQHSWKRLFLHIKISNSLNCIKIKYHWNFDVPEVLIVQMNEKKKKYIFFQILST